MSWRDGLTSEHTYRASDFIMALFANSLRCNGASAAEGDQPSSA